MIPQFRHKMFTKSRNLPPVSLTLSDRPGKLAFVLLIGLSGKDAAKNSWRGNDYSIRVWLVRCLSLAESLGLGLVPFPTSLPN